MSWADIPARINPVIFSAGGFSLQWYSVMYVAALATAYLLARRRIAREPGLFPAPVFEDAIPWIVLGIVAGARAGYVLFYEPRYFLARPWEVILPVRWEGGLVFTGIRGLSFHGGLAGGLAALWLFCRRRKADPVRLADLLASVGAFGYTFGRVGNFLNGELYGRETAVPWAMRFPEDPAGLLRHPSQLYEAAFEGLVLGGLLYAYARRRPRPGSVLAAYAVGYGLIRFALEWFREPDPQLGFVLGPLTMGQLLCLALAAAGASFFVVVNSKN